MIYADMSNENQNNRGNLLRDGKHNVLEEKTKFIKKSYPMPWQVELIDEEIEILRKGLKEDEIRYEAKAKRLAENTSLSESFNKNNRKE
jgi:hypothetical protein